MTRSITAASEPERAIILIVDDTPENLDILKGALADDYIVRPAPNGRIALRAAALDPHPDIILLDIMMPDMDGYEVCRRLKEDDRTRNIPIIFVTAKTEIEDELEGLRLGAVDYIAKPFSVPIVQARVKTHLALRDANRKLDEKNQILLHERELIEKIVLKMRHADVLDDRYLRHLISPVETTAGDILLSVFAPDGRQLVLLGDFTGHGLPAAIGGPLVTFILHEFAARSATGLEILEILNNQLCVRLPIDMFFACALVEVNKNRTGIQIWNSALPECLLIRSGQIAERIPSSLTPLGIVASLDFKQACRQLDVQRGDCLYAYSDGIVEDKNLSGEMFGQERLETFLTQTAVSKGDLRDLMEILDYYSAGLGHDDDITLAEVAF